MNLETFKARARRKLDLPRGNAQQAPAADGGAPAAADKAPAAAEKAPAAAEKAPAADNKETAADNKETAADNKETAADNKETAAAGRANEPLGEVPTEADDQKPDTETPIEPTTDSQSSSPSSTDKFAAALSEARKLEVARGNPQATDDRTVSKPVRDDRVDRRASAPERKSVQSLTGSPSQATLGVRQTGPQTAQLNEASEAELQRLRSLLLGDSQRDQKEQMEVVYQRTQAGINSLRQDMEASLDDLTKYVGQLEQSILNGIEDSAKSSQQAAWAAAAENTENRFRDQDIRLDALDVRLTNTLTNLRAELEADRESDRAFLKTELSKANERTDRLLESVSSRLETSIASIESRLSDQLNNRSAHLVADSETTIDNLRTQLGNLIDERVRTFNKQQSAGLVELRDTLLANTKEINSALKEQTEQQQSTLSTHRAELEKQFNAAIAVLTKSKVSHKELSQLLARLADQIKLHH